MDFLILYEHQQRELENACLLKTELEKRGYSVNIECVFSFKRYFYNPKVLIVPHIYNDDQVNNLGYNRTKSIKKILDLQYEQVLSHDNVIDNYHVPKEKAKNAHHIAWGMKQYVRYINNGIKPENISITGCIGMDLNYQRFDDFFYDKKTIAKMFNLQLNLKWILFISSFTLDNRTESEIKSYEKKLHSTREMREFMIISKSRIIDWIEAALLEYPNCLFIYRPHPAERTDHVLKIMENKYNNFKCIYDLSIRQWIRVADHLYTWYSTSIVDAFYAKKHCSILRPIKINENIDSELMIDSKFIESIDGFLLSLNNNNDCDFPIKRDRIISFYGEWDDGLAYKRIADLCERIYKNDSFAYDYRLNQVKVDRQVIKRLIKYFIFDICKYIRLSKYFGGIIPLHYKLELQRVEKEVYQQKKIIKDYCIRFKKLLSKET